MLPPTYYPARGQAGAEARAAALGVPLGSAWPPAEYVEVLNSRLPAVVAVYGAMDYLHDDGAITAADVDAHFAAMVAKEAADAQVATTAATVRSRVEANLANIEAWIAAHPTGAALTASQTLMVAKMLAGLCRLILDQFDTVGGA